MRQLELSDSEQVRSMEVNETTPEQLTLKDALSRFSGLGRFLNDIAGVKLRTPETLDELEKALKRVPTSITFGESLDEARADLERVIAAQRKERIQAFGRVEAEFIRAARERGTTAREVSEGWRIGKLEFQFRRVQSSARVLLNHEEIIGWKPIGEFRDLETLESQALKTLSSAEFPDEMLTITFWNAYDVERGRRLNAGKLQPELVPLPDFFRELRAAIVRFELAGQKPERSLRFVKLPRWSFVYNLDRYRLRSTLQPPGPRLRFQTGSQSDVQRGMGYTINGLDASQDYQTVCYVTAD